MASRIIHYAIAKLISEKYCINSFERFALGEILPDAYRNGISTYNSHLKISVENNKKKTYDLEKFRQMFSEKLISDDLYRGYYLHLIQDLYFRDMVYGKYHWNPAIEGSVQRLHTDYSIINGYVIEKYNLESSLSIPRDFEYEPINTLYPFDIQKLYSDFKSDFATSEENELYFFTKAMADEFIEYAVDKSLGELSAMDKGTALTNMYILAWKNSI